MGMEELRKLDRIHPYPAKYTVDLAVEYIEKYTSEGDRVYDPFIGSGTTLLAAKYLGRQGIGTDINHIAVLISRFKLLELTDENYEHLSCFLNGVMSDYPRKIAETEPYSYPSINHWFCEDAIKSLSCIKSCIDSLTDNSESIFCKTVMSSIINVVSNQESDTRYAAIHKPNVNTQFIMELFAKRFDAFLALYRSLGNDLCGNISEEVLLCNAKDASTVITENSVDLILTSPPYPNTYDYYLYHKHRMNWLGYDVKYSMEREIGSRREFSSLKHPKEKFDLDMLEILTEANKLLKVGGHVVLVMGDGKIQGEKYDAKESMEQICKQIGWRLADYSYTCLDNTSRAFQQSFRTKGKKEHILVFVKE